MESTLRRSSAIETSSIELCAYADEFLEQDGALDWAVPIDGELALDEIGARRTRPTFESCVSARIHRHFVQTVCFRALFFSPSRRVAAIRVANRIHEQIHKIFQGIARCLVTSVR